MLRGGIGLCLIVDGLCEYLLCVCVDDWMVVVVCEYCDGMSGVVVDVGEGE